MQHYEGRLLRVLDYIHDQADDDLSLDTLADVAAMSRFHFHRVYHAVTGETCTQTVRRVRLYRAACRLVVTDEPLEHVATASGYATVPAFSRAFRGMYGVPPGQFRQTGVVTPPTLLNRTGEITMYTVTIAAQPDRRLACLSHTGSYMDIGEKFDKLKMLCSTRGMWPQISGMLGIYYDDPGAKPEADLESAAALILSGDASVDAPMYEEHLAGGRTAILEYKGPYPGLHEAYKYLYGDWLPKSGEEARDIPPYEVYLNSPEDTAPDDLRTNVCLPLA